MSKVFVVDTLYKPLDPVHPGYARMLLSSGQAAVYRRYPFTLILKRDVEQPVTHPLRVKIDPGSKTTGLALLNDATGEVVWGAELFHRGQAVRAALDDRRNHRRSRRQRHTRYRQPRFENRRRKEGWLPPSLVSRIANIDTWVRRLMRVCPVQAISQELVRFDTQSMSHPEIQGVEYQQGELAGYEVRAYLLEKWNRRCAYCGAKDVPLQVEHMQPRARGGTNRVSNLTLACESCNTKKGTQDIRDFLHDKPDVLKRLLASAKAPLKDASAVNATRWVVYERLQALGVPVEGGTGGRTTYNRVNRGLDKAHWIDAACVGASTPDVLYMKNVKALLIQASGHGCRQMCCMDRYGFPRTRSKQAKLMKGFQTGDIVKAMVTTGAKQGTYVGRVAVRTSGSFNIKTPHGVIQGISHRFCTMLHHSDGYSYQKGEAAFSPVA